MTQPDLKKRLAKLSPEQKRLLVARLQAGQYFSNGNNNGKRKSLVAYLSGNVDSQKFFQILREKLPDYMVPSKIVRLDDFPRLPNGKVDLKALSEFKPEAPETQTDFKAPVTDLEKKLAAIWEEVLHFQPVGLNDNFFEIGGDSILSIQIIAKARKAGINLGANQLFRHQTIGCLSEAMEKKETPLNTEIQSTELAEPKMSFEALPGFSESDMAGIEAVHPLSPSQDSLLFHSLYEGHSRLGFLQVSVELEGNLDEELFVKAWKLTIASHPVLRTSIHWEQLKKPAQVVWQDLDLAFETEDWQMHPAELHSEMLAEKLASDRENGYHFSKPPLMRWKLFRLAKEKFTMIWSAHHIIMDGWSWSLLFKEVFENYKHLVAGKEVVHHNKPAFFEYLSWLENKNTTSDERFWRKLLAGYHGESLLGKKIFSSAKDHFETLEFGISESQGKQLQKFAQDQKITLNTLMQGAWALLLYHLSGRRDIVFGNTLSGRSADFPGIDSIIGLFTNTLPLRCWIFENMQLSEWLNYIFEEQSAIQLHEHTPLAKIQSWCGIESNSLLFESLLIFQNFKVGNFEEHWNGKLDLEIISGGLSSNYPLSLMVSPDKGIRCHLTFNKNWFSDEYAHQISVTFNSILQKLPRESEKTLDQIIDLIPEFKVENSIPGLLSPENLEQAENAQKESFLAPKNKTELELLKIWESLFSLHPISVNENFFEIGGRSILAVQLFSRIEEKFGKNLPPIILLEYPSIEKLADILDSSKEDITWSCLVPLRAGGKRPPLYCIHAGEAHVFFYKDLVKYLEPDLPVYALQPAGLGGTGPVYSNIEEMAAHYLEEIKTLQPQGPYSFLSICYGDPINIEMARQLREEGSQVSFLGIVDSAPDHLISPDPEPGIIDRAADFLKRFKNDPLKAVSGMVIRRMGKLAPKTKEKVLTTELSLQEKNFIKWQSKMVEAYEAYTWEPYDGKAILFHSTESDRGPYKQKQIDLWNTIVTGGMEVRVIEGHHRTIFEEPEVRNLAAEINKCLLSSAQDNGK